MSEPQELMRTALGWACCAGPGEIRKVVRVQSLTNIPDDLGDGLRLHKEMGGWYAEEILDLYSAEPAHVAVAEVVLEIALRRALKNHTTP